MKNPNQSGPVLPALPAPVPGFETADSDGVFCELQQLEGFLLCLGSLGISTCMFGLVGFSLFVLCAVLIILVVGLRWEFF